MTRVRQVVEALDRIAPPSLAFSFDRVGLQVGDPDAAVSKGVVTLDRSMQAVEFARSTDAQIIVAHHPLIFQPLNEVTQDSHAGRTLLELARNGIAFAAAHTNWDCARGGINDALALALDLRHVEAFGSSAQEDQLKVVVFCPTEAVNAVIDAAAATGAGAVGLYTRCAFFGSGTGTYLGGPETHPRIGEPGRIEQVDEARIEMVLPTHARAGVDEAIRRVHPYEEPAIDYLVLAPRDGIAIGRIGRLPDPASLQSVVASANERLNTACLAWGDPARPVRRLGVIGGSGDSEWRAAMAAGADALLTGEVKQHVALEAADSGFALIAAGHYATEQPGCAALRDRLAKALGEIDWLLFAPESGFAGRPFR